jgi:endoglucanase
MKRGLPMSCGLFLWLCASTIGQGAEPDKDAFYYNKLLGRGMNLGNALEAPKEGEWGVTLEADFFQKIKDAGFNSVRIPIRWSTHAGKDAPYEIEAEFFKRIDWAVEQALARDLVAIVNVHHFDEIYKDPAAHLPRLLGLWKQIASHYKDRSDRVFFEILNEPNDKLTDEGWQEMFPPLLATIRETNPKRMVIIGPSHWNSLDHLEKLNLPEKDRNLIATFHYYSPFQFTHQGAPWAQGADKWKGTTWKGTSKEKEALTKDFDKAAAWAKKNNRPLFLGEFGAYSAADMDSRAIWTRAIAREAEKNGFSWAYWEFCSGFGAYDAKEKKWRESLLKALVDK